MSIALHGNLYPHYTHGRFKVLNMLMLTKNSRIIRIGNSRGVRLSKDVLEEAAIADNEEVTIEVQVGQIIIRPKKKVREGWEEAFQQMAENGDDELLDAELFTASSWDEEEWEW